MQPRVKVEAGDDTTKTKEPQIGKRDSNSSNLSELDQGLGCRQTGSLFVAKSENFTSSSPPKQHTQDDSTMLKFRSKPVIEERSLKIKKQPRFKEHQQILQKISRRAFKKDS
ncbi:unnamed protein product [Sympodiomycopsis kandeliae]